MGVEDLAKDLELFTGLEFNPQDYKSKEDLALRTSRYEDILIRKLSLHRAVVNLIKADNEAADNIRPYGVLPNGKLVYTCLTGDIFLGDVYDDAFVVDDYETGGPDNNFTTTLSIQHILHTGAGVNWKERVDKFSQSFLTLLDEHLRTFSDDIILKYIRKEIGYEKP